MAPIGGRGHRGRGKARLKDHPPPHVRRSSSVALDAGAAVRRESRTEHARLRDATPFDHSSGRPEQRRGAAGKPAVHQVLATLGYGDAIGHEVLGIQRVLRGAGYESEIFVETADSRLEDLTVDYLDCPTRAIPTTS